MLKGNSEMAREAAQDQVPGPCEGVATHQFKWNQQGSRVLEQLKLLYNHPEVAGAVLGLQPDIALVSSDGGCVEAHRMVLSLCSAYFQHLFANVSQVTSPKLKDAPVVFVMGNLKISQLQQLLQFLYTGEVAVPCDQLEEFLEMGNAFQIVGIMDYRSSTENLSDGLDASSVILNADDANTEDFIGLSIEDNEFPVASSSTTVLYENVPHEDMELSYFYPKVETESEVDPLQDSTDYHDEDLSPNWSWLPEDDQPSSGCEMDDQEENDPTYEEKSVKAKRRRRTSGIDEVLRKSPQKVEWQVQDPVSDDIIKQEWRIRNQKPTGITYYCAFGGGKRCHAKLKKTVSKDGTVTWLNNKVAHSAHRKTNGPASVWQVIDPVSDKTLDLKWPTSRNSTQESRVVVTYYYCATGGKQCPAQLKKKVLNDGTVVWFAKKCLHNCHPDTQKMPQCKPNPVDSFLKKNPHAPKQNQFVLQCLEGGVTTTKDILLKLEIENLTPPEEQDL